MARIRLAALALLVAGCSSTSVNESNAGGSSSTGGDAGSDGSAAAGGSAGSSLDGSSDAAGGSGGDAASAVCHGSANVVDCGNATAGGVCPEEAQGFKYLCVDSTNGDAELLNTSDGRKYNCSVYFDKSDDAFDCKTGPKVGDQKLITSLGAAPAPCACNTVSYIGFPECTYSCRMTD